MPSYIHEDSHYHQSSSYTDQLTNCLCMFPGNPGAFLLLTQLQREPNKQLVQLEMHRDDDLGTQLSKSAKLLLYLHP